MSIVNILLGILMVIGGSYILAMPAIAPVAVCWFLTIAMLMFGIVSIIRYVEQKNSEKVAEREGKPHLKTGIGSLIFGIVSVVLVILITTSEERAEVFMKVVIVLFGLWVILDGISCIRRSMLLKQIGAFGWLPLLIMGIFVIIAGGFCIANTFIGIQGLSAFYGISMMMFGFTMMIA